MSELKKMMAFFFVVFILTACGGGSRVTQSLVAPDNISFSTQEHDLSYYEEKYGEYDAVYLSVDESYERMQNYSEDKALKYIINRRHKYLVLNPENEELSTWFFNSRFNEKIDNIYLKVYYPSGEVRTFTEEDLTTKKDEDMNQSLYYYDKRSRYSFKLFSLDFYGSQYIRFAIPQLVKGCVVEKGVELHSYSTINEEIIPTRYDYPVEKLNVEYIYPESYDLTIRQNDISSNKQYKKITLPDDGKIKISFVQENVPGITDEIYSPPYNLQRRMLEIFTSRKNADAEEGEVTGWSAIAKSIRERYIEIDWLSKDALQKYAEEITADYIKMEDKKSAIIQNIQNNFNLGRPKERMQEVLNSRSGSMVDLCAITKVMLEHVGMKAELLFANTVENGNFDEKFMSLAQFQNPMIKVTLEDKEFYAVPYIKFLADNYLPYKVLGRKAFVVHDPGGENFSFIDLPSNNYIGDEARSEFLININEDGKLEVEEYLLVNGSIAAVLREAFNNSPGFEKEEFLEEFVSYRDGRVEYLNKEFRNSEDVNVPFIIKVKYQIDNLVTFAGDEVIMQTGGIFSPLSIIYNKVNTSERINPIVTEANYTLLKNIKITFPESWNLTTNFENYQFSNEFGICDMKYTGEPGNFKTKSVIRMHKIMAPKEKITELLDFQRSINQGNLPALIFKK